VIGKPVVSIEQGRVIGKVADFYFDPLDGAVKLLEIDIAAGGGLSRLSGRRGFIRRADIRGMGPDAVTVTSDTAPVSRDAVSAETWATRSAKATMGESVVTERGKKVGQVGDFGLDNETMRVTSLEIKRGGGGLGALVGAGPEPKVAPLGPAIKLGGNVVILEESALD
jgi:sporulation protein YlmC with PRC-barrel domain